MRFLEFRAVQSSIKPSLSTKVFLPMCKNSKEILLLTFCFLKSIFMEKFAVLTTSYIHALAHKKKKSEFFPAVGVGSSFSPTNHPAQRRSLVPHRPSTARRGSAAAGATHRLRWETRAGSGSSLLKRAGVTFRFQPLDQQNLKNLPTKTGPSAAVA